MTTTKNGDDEKVSSNGTSKRPKTEIHLPDYISDDILKRHEEFKAQYAAAKPYRHAVLPNLLHDKFCRQVLKEIKSKSKVTFKESDLFKVYQSIDLANLDEDDEETVRDLPAVLQLRRVLYSNAWRKVLQDIAGLSDEEILCGEQVDCACNCHAPGCHLLCHDDVIGTRKISYILYLTEEDWAAEEGGALELYDGILEGGGISKNEQQNGTASSATRVPSCIPSKSILPLFNHMAFFQVEPGRSFHAVQEVFGDRPRLSLQGWYHTKSPPQNIQDATLQRLKRINEGSATDSDSEYYQTYPDDSKSLLSTNEVNSNGDHSSVSLSPSDKAYLQDYMHETYLQSQAIQDMRERFEDDSSIQMRDFLNESWNERIQHARTLADAALLPVTDPRFYQQGISDNWAITGPSHMQRFLQFHPPPASSSGELISTPEPAAIGPLLHEIQTRLLQSLPFSRYLSLITSLDDSSPLLGYRGSIRRFRPGLDYTVAHYGLLKQQCVLDATLCFVAGQGKAMVLPDADENDDDTGGGEVHELDSADADWQSGDVGGFECYIEADDDSGASKAPADEYNLNGGDDEEDDTELLSVSACNNTLSLVLRDPGTMRFVKYVSKKAPSSRWDIAIEYQLPDNAVDDNVNENEDDYQQAQDDTAVDSQGS